MTSPIKILSALALASAFAGTAFANDVVTGTNLRPCPMMKPVYKWETSVNPKVNATFRRLIGYKHESCTGTSIANMKCAGSKTACAAMIQI